MPLKRRRFWIPFAAGCALLTAALGASLQVPSPWRESKTTVPEVRATTVITPASAAPGETVTYKVTVDVDAPWHIYAWAPEPKGPGPRPTQLNLYETGGLTSASTWSADHAPTRRPEPAFPNLDAVEFHEPQVTWSTKLTVPPDAKPGPVLIKGQMRFQICDDRACKPMTTIALNDVTLEVAATAANGAKVGAVQAATTATALVVDAATPASTPPSATESKSSDALPQGEIGDAIRKGLVPFLLISALHGFLAVLMPCVWPLVPITVNFFVKQSQQGGGKATRLAIVYCLAIISMYTLIGLVATVVFGASTTKLGNNPWLNLVFGLAFIAFGLSLLGLFEIRLPSAWLNASSKGEARGGLVGVFFMAVTLTITSFTCTFPLVGSLLGLASKGQYFYPVVGLLTFSTVLSLPFFVLALVPSLVRSMPRGGDWMNAVKVVGGLLEIGAAFKFLNTAEVSFRGGNASAAIFDSQVVLAIWVVILIVCGVYLLGLFRTNHDHDELKVGPARLMTGVTFLVLALYLAPALFGNPPRGEIYRQIAGIFPPDANERLDSGKLIAGEIRRDLNAALSGVGTGDSSNGGSNGVRAVALDVPRAATSNDPKIAVREELQVHAGLGWGLSYEAAIEEAKAKKKPVLIDFTGVNCANCRNMESGVMPDPAVIEESKKFVRVRMYTDYVPIKTIPLEKAEIMGEDNLIFEDKLVGQSTSPFYVVVDPEGNVLATQAYDLDVSKFVSFLKTGLSKFEAQAKVAQK